MTARYTDPLELVGTLLGKYRVQSLVGEGGFAVVYRAVDTMLDRTVALKVLTAHLDPRAQNLEVQARVYAAFRAEAKLVAQLSDRNIVQIFDWGETETPSGARAPWMALEWVEGQTLESELAARRGRGGRPLAEALGLLRPLVEAVAHEHEVWSSTLRTAYGPKRSPRSPTCAAWACAPSCSPATARRSPTLSADS